jgi:hypothetical protein
MRCEFGYGSPAIFYPRVLAASLARYASTRLMKVISGGAALYQNGVPAGAALSLPHLRLVNCLRLARASSMLLSPVHRLYPRTNMVSVGRATTKRAAPAGAALSLPVAGPD